MRLCVFCGSAAGHLSLYVDAARQMGRTLAQQGIELIYGGGRVGLMGALADGALAAGGRVIGIMPRALVEKEIQHSGLTTLYTVETMAERKAKMADLADGFIALPGGAGTLEEVFEQWTWAQLGLHKKPCGFLNTNGYFDLLRRMIEHSVAEGFTKPDHGGMLSFDDEPLRLIQALLVYSPPAPKWLVRGGDE